MPKAKPAQYVDHYEAHITLRVAGPFDDALRARVEEILDDLLPRVTAPEMFDDDHADVFAINADLDIVWTQPIRIDR